MSPPHTMRLASRADWALMTAVHAQHPAHRVHGPVGPHRARAAARVPLRSPPQVQRWGLRDRCTNRSTINAWPSIKPLVGRVGLEPTTGGL